MVVVGHVDAGDLAKAMERVHALDTEFAFDDYESELDVGSILGAEDHDVGSGAVFASDSDEELEEEEEQEEEEEEKEEREDEQEEDKVQEEELRQVKGVLQAASPAGTQASIVSFHDRLEGIVDICSLETAMAAHATANEGNESPVTHCSREVGGNISRKPLPEVSAQTQAAPPRTATTPRREPPARCVKRRVFGAVVRVPATDANAEEMRSTQPEAPSVHSPQGHQSYGRRHSSNQQKRHSNGRGARVSVGGVGAGLGQKPVLGEIFRLDLDDDMGESSTKASHVGTPREQFQKARPPSIARSYATLGAEFHRLDGTSDSESWLPSSLHDSLSMPVNRHATYVSALEQDCGVGAYTKSSFERALLPPASFSSSSPRACSAKVNVILAGDGLQLVDCVDGAITDEKRPASRVPISARSGRAAESQLPAIHVPLSARQTNLERQPPRRSNFLVKESTKHADVSLTKAW